MCSITSSRARPRASTHGRPRGKVKQQEQSGHFRGCSTVAGARPELGSACGNFSKRQFHEKTATRACAKVDPRMRNIRSITRGLRIMTVGVGIGSR